MGPLRTTLQASLQVLPTSNRYIFRQLWKEILMLGLVITLKLFKQPTKKTEICCFYPSYLLVSKCVHCRLMVGFFFSCEKWKIASWKAAIKLFCNYQDNYQFHRQSNWWHMVQRYVVVSLLLLFLVGFFPFCSLKPARFGVIFSFIIMKGTATGS